MIGFRMSGRDLEQGLDLDVWIGPEWGRPEATTWGQARAEKNGKI